MLHGLKNNPEFRHYRMLRDRFFGCVACHADHGVQLIHSAVGLNALRVLGDALPAREARLAMVAAPRVYTVDSHPRIVVLHAFHFRTHLDLESVHFTPLTKFSSGEGKPTASS